MSTLVTGGRSGIGAAIAARFDDVRVLDVVDGFDVARADAWRALDGEFDAAFLNAGVDTGLADPAEWSDEAYRRIVGVNVDGVVFGVRELASRLMPRGGAIVVTASLAGLTEIPADPLYGLTKHAVVGLVRSVAPALAARGIRINAICPGFVDTPLLTERVREGLGGLTLLRAEDVADAALVALGSEETGRCFVVQPGRGALVFRYPGIPGPRA